ncbi:MAG: polyprenyl synthetase family protein [Phycisphaera sp.]|nr:polyprenyl synthetase family protein [Phycisphaera sp.]
MTASPDTDSLVGSTDEMLRELVETELSEVLDRLELAPLLDEATRYVLLGGGKRLRPILVLRACEAVGGEPKDAVPAAVALECIHAFSLVHDDLPAMDDDDLRRGRPTAHKVYGEDVAILVGDLLHCIAAETALCSPVEPRAIASVVMEGCRRMIEGQVHDTVGGFPAGLDDELSRLRLIHRLKTAALIGASCRVGSIVGGGDPENLERYGSAIGLMFQVVDDILDETQSTEHLGKTGGKDRVSGKRTYPAILGLDQSRAEVVRLEAEAIASLDALGPAADPLRALARALSVRTR